MSRFFQTVIFLSPKGILVTKSLISNPNNCDFSEFTVSFDMSKLLAGIYNRVKSAIEKCLSRVALRWHSGQRLGVTTSAHSLARGVPDVVTIGILCTSAFPCFLTFRSPSLFRQNELIIHVHSLIVQHDALFPNKSYFTRKPSTLSLTKSIARVFDHDGSPEIRCGRQRNGS